MITYSKKIKYMKKLLCFQSQHLHFFQVVRIILHFFIWLNLAVYYFAKAQEF